VVLLHVLLVWALVTGLARKVVDVIKKPIETKVVEEKKAPPPPEAPPPPPPKLEVPPPPFVPPPEIQIAIAPPANAITQVTAKAPPPTPVIKPVSKPPTPASLDRGTCASPEPAYPMSSRRNQEAGSLVLRIQIDASGAPGKVEIAKSSGFSRLDEAAKNWIGTCRFRPSTVEGKAVAGYATQAYTFTLRD
jgi:protein TonB